jgi:hypothetical protein
MRRCFTLALLTAVVAGCSDGATPTGVGAVRSHERNGSGGLAISVVGFRPFPDSVYFGVRGAVVIVSYVDSIPTDTVPTDTLPTDTTGVPPESLMVAGLRIGLLGSQPFLLDSIPVDTLPPDTVPPDTIPPDTNPPPPPPPPGCGRTGTVVARGRTYQQGLLMVSRLRPGKYDLKILPPERARLRQGFYCGAIVLEHRVTPATVTLFPLPPDTVRLE